MTDLFSEAELTDFLQQGPLNGASVVIARRVASGWLKDATQLNDWPDPVPDDLFAWALELGGLIYNNPESLASDTTGATSATWERGRRDAILDLARAAYADPDGGASGGPVYSFPEPDWSWISTTPTWPTC